MGTRVRVGVGVYNDGARLLLYAAREWKDIRREMILHCRVCTEFEAFPLVLVVCSYGSECVSAHRTIEF
jgi:hypothetical protein